MIRIDIATPASRLTALIGSLLVIALAALPWWGSAGALRLTTEIAYYIALAQLWNLLAGYAGLVSIGQQAYVGIGAYALFALTGVWGLPVYLALVLSGVVAGLLALPIALIVFRLKGAYRPRLAAARASRWRPPS